MCGRFAVNDFSSKINVVQELIEYATMGDKRGTRHAAVMLAAAKKIEELINQNLDLEAENAALRIDVQQQEEEYERLTRFKRKPIGTVHEMSEDVDELRSDIEHLRKCLEAERFAKALIMADRDRWKHISDGFALDYRKRHGIDGAWDKVIQAYERALKDG